MAGELANDGDRASTARMRQATQDDKTRIREPERALARKDRALAETAALLGPGKRAAAIQASDEDAGSAAISPDCRAADRSGHCCGARRAKACAKPGISDRTLRRWTKGYQICPDQRPVVHRPAPHNKLKPR